VIANNNHLTTLFPLVSKERESNLNGLQLNFEASLSLGKLCGYHHQALVANLINGPHLPRTGPPLYHGLDRRYDGLFHPMLELAAG
jgi:hypothetical protein